MLSPLDDFSSIVLIRTFSHTVSIFESQVFIDIDKKKRLTACFVRRFRFVDNDCKYKSRQWIS
jgi:hypothetical protein